MTHYIYKLTNSLNGKIYIGQSKDVKQRWRTHQAAARNGKPTQIVHHAIIKYGIENFTFEVIDSCNTQEEINSLEEHYIKLYDCYIANGKGYNGSLGGSVAPKTEEWKKKVSAHHKQYYKERPELLQKMLDGFKEWHKENPDALKGENCNFFGKRPPEENIQNLQNYVRIHGSHRKGVKVSEEERQKMSERMSGDKHPFFGKHRSEETKRKIGNGNRGKVRTQEMRDHISRVKTGNSKPNSGSFQPGGIPWNKKTTPSQEDHEIYQKHKNGQTISSLALEYNKLWKTIKKSINRVTHAQTC